MELAPFPGTALYKQNENEGRLDRETPWREQHGQDRLWFRHHAFTSAASKEILDRAFRSEYERLGPSLCALPKHV